MSKRKKCIPIVVFILFIAVGISKAEPTPTISYLMQTPVSMLDFGIFKLEKFLNEPIPNTEIYSLKPVSVKVDYLYDQNRLKILFMYTNKSTIKKIKSVDLKRHITRTIKNIKVWRIGMDSLGLRSNIVRFFKPDGYVRKNEPKNIGKELDQITEIHIDFLSDKEWIKCKSPLIGDKIFWEK
jgi:hypothetical protein